MVVRYIGIKSTHLYGMGNCKVGGERTMNENMWVVMTSLDIPDKWDVLRKSVVLAMIICNDSNRIKSDSISALNAAEGMFDAIATRWGPGVNYNSGTEEEQRLFRNIRKEIRSRMRVRKYQ